MTHSNFIYLEAVPYTSVYEQAHIRIYSLGINIYLNGRSLHLQEIYMQNRKLVIKGCMSIKKAYDTP